MSRVWIYLFSALCALALAGVCRVEGIEVFTSPELEAVNGTEVKLKCTFKSALPLDKDKISVSWTFQPLEKKTDETIFYYNGQSYPSQTGLFNGHAVWSGDVMKGDASITLQDVQFNFNGTYSCHVRNPPDVQGFKGEINLRVVQKVSFSEIGILAIAVGGSIGILLVILIIYMVVRGIRRQDDTMDVEMEDHRSKNQML